jgi:hypothetical protein
MGAPSASRTTRTVQGAPPVAICRVRAQEHSVYERDSVALGGELSRGDQSETALLDDETTVLDVEHAGVGGDGARLFGGNAEL